MSRPCGQPTQRTVTHHITGACHELAYAAYRPKPAAARSNVRKGIAVEGDVPRGEEPPPPLRSSQHQQRLQRQREEMKELYRVYNPDKILQLPELLVGLRQ